MIRHSVYKSCELKSAVHMCQSLILARTSVLLRWGDVFIKT